MFFKIINYLNSKKNFPYYISTPIVYGIGGASEHIAMVAAHAKRLSKKILKPGHIGIFSVVRKP